MRVNAVADQRAPKPSALTRPASEAGASPHQAWTAPRGSARAIQLVGAAPSIVWRAAEKSTRRLTAIPPPCKDRPTSGLRERASALLDRSRAARPTASRRAGGTEAVAGAAGR